MPALPVLDTYYLLRSKSRLHKVASVQEQANTLLMTTLVGRRDG